MNFDESGTLTVRVYTAGGAIPIEGTVIRIAGATEENRFYESELITDSDGVTAKISLPAPKRTLSLAPGAPEVPYSIYDLTITAPGYYEKHIYGLAVFSGVESLQPIAMIPLGGDLSVPGPRDNLDIYVKENERLE